MQAGVPPCSSHRSTQRKSEVERSGGTRKQVLLTGEGVQPAGQAAAMAGSKRMTVTITRLGISAASVCNSLLQPTVPWGVIK